MSNCNVWKTNLNKMTGIWEKTDFVYNIGSNKNNKCKYYRRDQYMGFFKLICQTFTYREEKCLCKNCRYYFYTEDGGTITDKEVLAS